MSLYKLNYENKDLSDGFMEKANKYDIDYEKDFENWLENSPHVLLENTDNSTIMWIGRQVTARFDDRYKFPDLMGIDAEGNVVIVELKKGRTPKEVIAQILEYASWAEKLSYEQLNNMAMKYYDLRNEYQGMELRQIHNAIFYLEDDTDMNIIFNRKVRLFIVAEEVSGSIKDTVNFLNKFGVDINCLKYDVFSAENGNYYISTEIDEFTGKLLNTNTNCRAQRWSGDEPVKRIIRKIVDKVILSKSDDKFTMKEVMEEAKKEFPELNTNTIRCSLYADCVNHSSRKHYKSGQMDYYFRIEGTNFRLYNRENDGVWTSDGKRLESR